MKPLNNHSQIGLLLNQLKEALAPYVLSAYKKSYRNHYLQEITEVLTTNSYQPPNLTNDDTALRDIDVLGWLNLMNRNDKWHSIFAEGLPRKARSFVTELINVRHEWAHQKPLDSDDLDRAYDTANRLLKMIGSDVELAMPEKHGITTKTTATSKTRIKSTSEELQDIVEIHKPAIAVIITQKYNEGMSPALLYETTRRCWNFRGNQLNQANLTEYVFAIASSMIVQVYRRIGDWYPAHVKEATTSDHTNQECEGRWEFEGVIADEMQHYVGKRIERSYGSAFRFYNC